MSVKISAAAQLYVICAQQPPTQSSLMCWWHSSNCVNHHGQRRIVLPRSIGDVRPDDCRWIQRRLRPNSSGLGHAPIWRTWQLRPARHHWQSRVMSFNAPTSSAILELPCIANCRCRTTSVKSIS